MSAKLVYAFEIINLHAKLQLHIVDLEKTLRGLRNSVGHDDKWRKDIEQDKRPTVRLLYRELVKAEANIRAVENLAFAVEQPTDMDFITSIQKGLEV